MNLSVINGEAECMKLFEEISDYELKKVANKIGETVEKRMKSDIAVDTGNAQKSVKAYFKRISDGYDVTIYPSTRYYYYQEVGTSRFKGNIGRLSRAIADTRQECFDIAKEVVKRK